ncbi:MAG: hypothetical protein WD944_05380 [Steroidobacteraceae bacterium]
MEQHYPAFRALRLMEGRSLPVYVEAEFGAYLKCGRLEEGQRRYAADQHKAGSANKLRQACGLNFLSADALSRRVWREGTGPGT